MEHGHAVSQPHTDPGDFVAEQARIKKAKPNYVGVFIFLGILTAIEVAITTYFPNTIGRVPVLLFLTVAKGLLVVLYYMHLKFDSRLYAIFFGAGVLAFALPFVIAMIFLMAPPELAPVRAALGENQGEQTARPTANPNAGPPLALNAEVGDYFFKPDVVNANSGQAVTISLKNTGSVEHNWTIGDKNKSEEPQPWNNATAQVQAVAKALAGASGRGGFIAPAPGEYVFYCSVPGHAVLGMIGTLVVK
ncbi:MAG: cytochrome C oxidase subunit IV family protein [Chloroflexi bacterium]|nr:cytochrome C oxidase subunit IV family protein [Chloroflexota bacterium]